MEVLTAQGFNAQERYGGEMFQEIRDIPRVMYPGTSVVPKFRDENIYPGKDFGAGLESVEYMHNSMKKKPNGQEVQQTDQSYSRVWNYPKGMRFI